MYCKPFDCKPRCNLTLEGMRNIFNGRFQAEKLFSLLRQIVIDPYAKFQTHRPNREWIIANFRRKEKIRNDSNVYLQCLQSSVPEVKYTHTHCSVTHNRGSVFEHTDNYDRHIKVKILIYQYQRQEKGRPNNFQIWHYGIVICRFSLTSITPFYSIVSG